MKLKITRNIVNSFHSLVNNLLNMTSYLRYNFFVDGHYLAAAVYERKPSLEEVYYKAHQASLAQGQNNYSLTQSLAQGQNSANNCSLAQGISNTGNSNSLAQGIQNSAVMQSMAQGAANKAHQYILDNPRDVSDALNNDKITINDCLWLNKEDVLEIELTDIELDRKEQFIRKKLEEIEGDFK